MISLSACTTLFKLGPDYERPASSVSDQWYADTSDLTDSGTVQKDWWRLFEDPQLNGYIDKALLDNKNLQAANARVLQARALRAQAKSEYYPQIQANGERFRQGTSGTTAATFFAGLRRTIITGTVDASWELDIFGRIARSNEAAQARLEETIELKRATLIGILAEVARSYYEVRGAQKRIEITEKNIALQEQTFGLIESLYQLGEASEFDLARAKGQLELTRSRLPDLTGEMQAATFRLSVLIGQAPETLLEDMLASKPLPIPPNVVPTGLRSEILRRRPDVRAAERALASATADIGVAVANLYPNFSLTGSAGRSASAFEDLLERNSNLFNVRQAFNWPIFAGGALKSQIQVEKAEAKEALALYEQAILDSLADTETALTLYAKRLQTRNRLQESVDSSRRAAELARALFDGGEEDFLAVLDAERELISVEDELILSEVDTILNLISVYAALGGGWDTEQKIETPKASFLKRAFFSF